MMFKIFLILKMKGFTNKMRFKQVALKRTVLVSYNPKLGSLFGLLGQKDSVDVWQNTTLGDCHTSHKFVELLVVSDGQLKVTRDDTGFLVVTGSIAGQFQDLSDQVLENSGHIDGSSGTNSFAVVSFSKQTVDSTNGKLETSSG